MIRFKPLPALETLKELFSYDPDTGILYKHLRRPRGVVRPVESKTSLGYLYTHIRPYGNFGVHRLIWKLYHGEDPGNMTIDHINRNPSDNRISNLRLADSFLQTANRSIAHSNGVGIRRHPTGKWLAHIELFATRYSKTFNTKEECRRWRADMKAWHKQELAKRTSKIET